MPKIKVPRSSPSLDMTPMVDLAFLLVTFFMLTTKFRPDEPVVVDMPSSVSETKLPNNIMTVTVDSAGRVFYDIDGQQVRKNLLQKMGVKYKISFTPEELERFAVMTTFGMPIAQLKGYIDESQDQRKTFNQQTKGVPTDSLHNELADWINFGRYAAADDYQAKKQAGKPVKDLRFAIKGDGQANYKIVKKVIDIFQDEKVNRFNLVTNLKKQ
ncbi:MAG TPA: biopolymer transporter ExbD [Bacteroidia bacterium]|nr:biopolymer transporter ExbD [Bacteroidia bacterium]